MKISGIYCIRNTANGKRYIGQSTDINFRLIQHKSSLKHGHHYNKHLQRAFDKYGIDNFEFFIIGKHHEILLDIYEQVWIVEYKSNNPSFGYNVEAGGHKNKHFSDETKAKLRKRWKERKKTPRPKSHCDALSNSVRSSWAKRRMNGKEYNHLIA